MRVNFEQVCPEDFDAYELWALARKGKLYLKVEAEDASKEDLLAACRQEVLAYVSAIDDYATDMMRPYINKVWESIVKHQAFSRSLMMQKGRNRGHMNRYFITALVVWMSNRGVYQSGISSLRLHQKLEGVKKKTSIYTSALNYAPSTNQETILRQLLKSIK